MFSRQWALPFRQAALPSRIGYATVASRHVKNGWEAVIGIEVHAQINSKSKLFSDSPTSFDDPTNARVSVVDGAFPGVQPTLNQRCVDLAVKTALALRSDIQPRSTFDRKHYFYPDLPQGYQITQHREPIALGGYILLSELDGVSQPVRVDIQQLQLEQDTGKSHHDLRPGYTLLDLNRAGIGLMEIVTKPDLRSSFEAGLLVKKLQSILRCVGSSKANMEEGSMRCDVNVSVHRPGESLGTRCELKNLNSVRFLSMAIDAEIRRQIDLIEKGNQVEAETRGYDVAADKTFRLRRKETAPDYRYMPEPDLPVLELPLNYIADIALTLPELPDQSRSRVMKQYDISLNDATVLLNEQGSLKYFEQICKGRSPKSVLNWTLHELFGQLAGHGIPFQENPISADQLGSLVDLVQNGTITGPTGKNVLRLMLDNPGTMPLEIVNEKGWLRISDDTKLKMLCEQLIIAHPKKAANIRGGNPKMFKWFIGQVMRDTRGMADPVQLNAVLCDALGCKYDDVVGKMSHPIGKKSKKHV